MIVIKISSFVYLTVYNDSNLDKTGKLLSLKGIAGADDDILIFTDFKIQVILS